MNYLTAIESRDTSLTKRMLVCAGEYVCISIIDTGIGMDEVTLKRAAKPFFTTKGVAKGTGLGLSMVYGLAAQSDGWIRMSSQPGHGTTVELFFPLSESNPSVEPAMEKQPVTMVDTPRCILVVDDDVLVAESISEMLSDLGHTVYVAYSGAAALELIYEHAEIELVLTDHAMPEMTGIELASLSRKFKPSLPIVLGTGYAGPSEGTDLQLPRLSKPYRQDDLRSLIASIFSTK